MPDKRMVALDHDLPAAGQLDAAEVADVVGHENRRVGALLPGSRGLSHCSISDRCGR
jgi:hypothetical protein